MCKSSIPDCAASIEQADFQLPWRVAKFRPTAGCVWVAGNGSGGGPVQPTLVTHSLDSRLSVLQSCSASMMLTLRFPGRQAYTNSRMCMKCGHMQLDWQQEMLNYSSLNPR